MKWIMSTNSSRWLAVIFAVAVVIGSSLPGSSLPDLGGIGVDKLLHFSQYAILSYLVTRGWGPGRFPGRAEKGAWLLGAFMLAFAGMDEFHQRWIPGRSVEFADWLADAAGVTASFLLGYWVNRRMCRTPREL